MRHVEPVHLHDALCRAAERSFNCISVEGHTSTNDTLLRPRQRRVRTASCTARISTEFDVALAGRLRRTWPA